MLGLGAAFQWQRISLHLEVHGAIYDTSYAIFQAWQITTGFGFQLLSHEAEAFSLAWRARGELGVGIATAIIFALPPVFYEFEANANLLGAGLMDLSLLFHLGNGIDLGAIATFGFQQGFSVIGIGGVPVMRLHGLFAGVHLVLGFAL